MQRISTSQPLNDTHVTAITININSVRITSTIPLKVRRWVRIPDASRFFVLRFFGSSVAYLSGDGHTSVTARVPWLSLRN